MTFFKLFSFFHRVLSENIDQNLVFTQENLRSINLFTGIKKVY